MDANRPVLFVIFGVSGDLSRRKLLPALYRLVAGGKMPSNYQIIGVSRQNDYTVDQLFSDISPYLPTADAGVLATLHQHTRIVHNNLSTPEDFAALRSSLQQDSATLGDNALRVYYLSIPPAAFNTVVRQLGEAGHNNPFPNESDPPRLLVEKPFGYDSDSARTLIESADQQFGEQQIYRIDHYLARETAQNILVFRFKNALFESIWNSRHISHVKIAAFESIDIEGRVNFYEQTGALRDLIQSHLLQLLALVMMDRPSSLTSDSIHAAKLAFLQAITPINASAAVRGQYNGYRQAVGNHESRTETFARLNLTVNNQQWQGTTISLETGKALHERVSFAEVTFRPYAEGAAPNVLTFRLQPREGITLHLQAKQPGLTDDTQAVEMDFDYTRAFSTTSAEPYERVIRDAIRGDQTLFASGPEVLASWRIVDDVLHQWASTSEGLLGYDIGSKPEDIV